MKKIFLFLFIILSMTTMAQQKSTTKSQKETTTTQSTNNFYGKGAVPEKNGIIVFEKSFKVPGWTEQKIKSTLLYYIKDVLMANAIQDIRTRMTTDDNADTICARIEEWIVFKKKFLYLDQTRFRYQLTANVTGNKVTLSISQISYYYREDWDENKKPTGEGGIDYKAEEWITDSEALSKKTPDKLLPVTGKFRRKTIDRVTAIFDNCMDLFEAESKEEAAKKSPTPVKEEPKRKYVEE